jgi:hypothetical protein
MMFVLIGFVLLGFGVVIYWCVRDMVTWMVFRDSVGRRRCHSHTVLSHPYTPYLPIYHCPNNNGGGRMYEAKRHVGARHVYLDMDRSLVWWLPTHTRETNEGEWGRGRSTGLSEATNLGEQGEEWEG